MAVDRERAITRWRDWKTFKYVSQEWCVELADERDLLREELRIREESQIPVIPRGAQNRIEFLEARLEEFKFDLAETLGRAERAEAESISHRPRYVLGHSGSRFSVMYGARQRWLWPWKRPLGGWWIGRLIIWWSK